MTEPLLALSQTRCFIGGITSPHRLDHSEGVAIDPLDSSIWCGGEGGQIYHIAPDGSDVEVVAHLDGMFLGVTLGPNRHLYVCDLLNRCVVEVTTGGQLVRRLTATDRGATLTLPNFSVLSADLTYLYVSDTVRSGGGGIWRFHLATGQGELWMSEPCMSANGMALDPSARNLYLVESHRPGVARVPILENGDAGPKVDWLLLPGLEPDGLAFHPSGDLFISVYHPSRIYRWSKGSGLELLLADEVGDHLHHPTNIAFRGSKELISTNFGAWHLTKTNLEDLYV